MAETSPATLLPKQEQLIISTDGGHPYELTCQPDQTVSRLGGGFNAEALRVGELVVKTSKRTYTQARAFEVGTAMNKKRLALANYHDTAHLAPSSLWVVNTGDKERNRLVTMQHYIPGRMLDQHLEADGGTAEICSFLGDALKRFAATGEIVDLANIETRFDLMHTGNIVITPEATPVLVDLDPGRIQSWPISGPIWNRAIAWGVSRGLEQIRQPEQ